jgi:predicted nucleic acid-binding protein
LILYADSSALFKVYFDEPGSDEMRQRIEQSSAVATSALAYPEIRTAFARRRRERTITPKQLAEARQQFESDWPTFAVLPLGDALTLRAGALAEEHGIRGADAVHLAAFERLLMTADDGDVEFSCADERLSRAARRLG